MVSQFTREDLSKYTGERPVLSINKAGENGHHTQHWTPSYTADKNWLKPHNFPHQTFPVLSPLKTDTLSISRTQKLSPQFPHLSFNGTSSPQVLRRPDSHQPELNSTMSQSWSPSGSWRNKTPISLNWTPQCPKTETPAGPEETRLLSAWTEPHNVPKMKPQWVLRRPESCQWPHPARCSVREGIPTGVGEGQGGRLLVPCQPMRTGDQASLTQACTA